ncbi:hypothetical protein [Nannocystis sp.]|uniref:hypothetical protein n=1 Tax=Nannocystis sp. TaxID=1962667 RepID=UPI0025F13E67|nr:hypothetical protein [Nannocystis sp.]MBK7828572.1 hypothetical protein [Nannocystis sp.]
MKHNSWSEINIGKSCAHAQTLARARLASKAWGLALGGMLSSGCILLGSDNDTGQNTDSNGPTTAAGSTTADTTPTTTAAGSTSTTPTTEGSISGTTSGNSDSQTTDPDTTTDASTTGTGTDTTGTGTDATGTGTDTGTSTDASTGTTGGGGLGEGEVCQDNPDGCAPGLLCCYPCGIPDCMNKCIKPDPNTQMCPLFP